MDRYKNIFAVDSTTNELKAFSNEVTLYGKKGESSIITGIDMNSKNEVVIACICNTKCMIRKLSSLNV